MSDTGAAPLRLPFGKRLRYAAEASGFFLLMGIFKLLGVDGASAFGGFIGRRILYPSNLTKRARENLVAAFPEKSAAEIEAILLAMWDNLGRTIGEYPHFEKFSPIGPNARVEFRDTEIFRDAQTWEKGALLFSGHLANWEIMHIAITKLGLVGGAGYRPANNPHVDRWIHRQRCKSAGLEMIAKGPRGTRRIFTLLRANKPVSLFVDQKTNEGVPARFFGREAMTTPLPALLALRLDKKLIPISNRRTRGAHFEVTAHAPLQFTPSGDSQADVLALTQAMTAKVEEMIRANPAQWLWIHRRWPTEKDRITSKRAAQSLGGSGESAERDGSSLT